MKEKWIMVGAAIASCTLAGFLVFKVCKNYPDLYLTIILTESILYVLLVVGIFTNTVDNY